jgi:hypothetical protein
MTNAEIVFVPKVVPTLVAEGETQGGDVVVV